MGDKGNADLFLGLQAKSLRKRDKVELSSAAGGLALAQHRRYVRCVSFLRSRPHHAAQPVLHPFRGHPNAQDQRGLVGRGLCLDGPPWASSFQQQCLGPSPDRAWFRSGPNCSTTTGRNARRPRLAVVLWSAPTTSTSPMSVVVDTSDGKTPDALTVSAAGDAFIRPGGYHPRMLVSIVV